MHQLRKDGIYCLLWIVDINIGCKAVCIMQQSQPRCICISNKNLRIIDKIFATNMEDILTKFRRQSLDSWQYSLRYPVVVLGLSVSVVRGNLNVECCY